MQERRAANQNSGLTGFLKAKQQVVSVGLSLLLWAYSALCPLLPTAGPCILLPSPGKAAASWEGWP